MKKKIYAQGWLKTTVSSIAVRVKYGKPNPIFDDEWYLTNYPDVARRGVDPWAHFMRYGRKEGRKPNALFDPDWYSTTNPDVLESPHDPFMHYHLFGRKEGRAPFFDGEWYSEFYPDVRDSGLDPFEHYRLYGRKEGRWAFNDVESISNAAKKEGTLSERRKADLGSASALGAEYSLRKYASEDGRFYHEYAGMAVDPIGAVKHDVKSIAFYLPQMHPIPQNDQWWGKGFTEWINVSKAIPRFNGHYQPRLPGELGYYDLRCFETMERQVELAKTYGLYAFCFYYYWFSGTRLLERPLDMFLENKTLNIPFCVCWANENWTRRWDGLDSDILIGQNHSSEDSKAVFYDWLRYFNDDRYIRIEGKPLILIYRPDLIPNFDLVSQMWRQMAIENGFGGLYILGVSAFGNVKSPETGLDGTYDFPPHNIHAPQITSGLEWLDKDAKTRAFSYKGAVDFIEKEYQKPSTTQSHSHPGVLVGWDTEARKPGRGDVFLGNTPELFRRWLKAAFIRARSNPSVDTKFVFINAWNEWAEGAYLEPDRRHGYGYLTALRSVVREFGIDSSEINSICSRHNAAAASATDKAIMLHLFYFDLVDDFKEILDEVSKRDRFDLIVSFPDLWSADQVNEAITKLKPRKAFIAENCGRDVYPFLKMGQQIKDDGYRYACKIHSKKSTHRIDGAQWRQNLLNGLLSEGATKELAKSFFGGNNFAIAAPQGSYLPLSERKYVDGNVAPLNFLVERFNIAGGYRSGDFVAGTMFWFDFDVFKPIFEADLGPDEFGVDMGQVDGTLAHAFERFFALYAKDRGKRLYKMSSSPTTFDVNKKT